MAVAGLESLTGTIIEVAVGEPATEDASGYSSLSWERVVGVVSFGEWGDTENDVNEPLLTEGRVIHMNGASDGGEATISIQHRTEDAGAALIKANSGGNQIMSVRKTYPSGDQEAAYGVFTSPKYREASNDSVRGWTAILRVNSKVTEIPA